jgi:hypothetical protein
MEIDVDVDAHEDVDVDIDKLTHVSHVGKGSQDPVGRSHLLDKGRKQWITKGNNEGEEERKERNIRRK